MTEPSTRPSTEPLTEPLTKSSTEPLIEARGLVKHFAVTGRGLFARREGTVHAVNRVDLAVAPGETLALIGESGCGKTTLGRTLAGLYPSTAGEIRFRGRPLARSGRGLRGDAAREVQMVFQDPYASLDPRMTAGAIIEEPLRIHGVGDRRERRERVASLLREVGLAPSQVDRYPHEFSGGQRQRIGIARALAPSPALVIADEPVSALDVSIQSQILNLLSDLRDRHGLAYLFITHDLAVVSFIADRVAVMYLGHIVETAPRDALFGAPRHPYTQALRAAIPVPGGGKRRRGGALPGDVPSPLAPPAGCPFHTRCPKAAAVCRSEPPALEAVGSEPAHRVACHFPS